MNRKFNQKWLYKFTMDIDYLQKISHIYIIKQYIKILKLKIITICTFVFTKSVFNSLVLNKLYH